MKFLAHYPLIGLVLAILGGILLVWYFARPKAKRPFDDVAELRDPLPPLDSAGRFTFPENTWDEPIAGAPVVAIRRPSGKRDKNGRFTKAKRGR